MSEQEIPVVLLTQDGALDALSPDTYREIYDEFRGYDEMTGRYAMALDAFCALLQSSETKAEWSRWQRGQRELTRAMCDELRKAVGIPPLNLTLHEAMDAHVEPNARVYKVGREQIALRIVLLATDDAVTIHANGSVAVVAAKAASRVQKCTASRTSVSLPSGVFAQANAVRLAHGLSWQQLIALGLDALAET